MTKKDILKELLKNSILPILFATVLFLIACQISTKDGHIDYFYVWIICGLPFGIGKLRTWFYMRGGSLGVSVAVFILNFILAGLVGGFVLIKKLCTAIYYLPIYVSRIIRTE